MGKKKKPKKWTSVYPAGTIEGDEECRFFKALARNVKFQWRSTAALVKEASLSKKRVEEIIAKYFQQNMVFQSPKNEDHWGYWERCPELLPDVDQTIAQADQGSRIDKGLRSAVDWKTPNSIQGNSSKYLSVDWKTPNSIQGNSSKYLSSELSVVSNKRKTFYHIVHNKQTCKQDFVDLSCVMNRKNRFREYERLHEMNLKRAREQREQRMDNLLNDLKSHGLHCTKGDDPKLCEKYRKHSA